MAGMYVPPLIDAFKNTLYLACFGFSYFSMVSMLPGSAWQSLDTGHSSGETLMDVQANIPLAVSRQLVYSAHGREYLSALLTAGSLREYGAL